MNYSTFTFDLMTTVQCTLRCKYCIEAEHFNFYSQKYTDLYNVDDVIKFFKEQINLKPFTDYDMMCINFWGGEPTLKPEIIFKVVKELHAYNKKFKFFMSSNGFKIDKIIDFLDEIKSETDIAGEPLFVIQISYDGEPVQTIKRLDINGKPHTNEVLETIHTLRNKNIPYVLKSTITLDTIGHLYECYKDVISLTPFYSTYFPTIDYRTEHLNEYIKNNIDLFDILKRELFKIAKDELPYMRVHNGESRFRWFNFDRAECVSGRHYFAIDLDGNIYKCHGCLSNRSKAEHCIGNITDKNINKQINSSISEYVNARNIIGDVCSNCDATYCLRCNSSKYDSSNKEDYWERWFDFKSQDNLCKFYKFISNVSRAVKLKI